VMTSAWQTDSKKEFCHRFDNGSTLTDGRTDGLTHDLQDSGSKSYVPDTPNPVDNPDSVRWVIRKKRFWGTGHDAWRVTHPSLPAYFNHSYHLDTFEDAIEYACAKAHWMAGAS